MLASGQRKNGCNVWTYTRVESKQEREKTLFHYKFIPAIDYPYISSSSSPPLLPSACPSGARVFESVEGDCSLDGGAFDEVEGSADGDEVEPVVGLCAADTEDPVAAEVAVGATAEADAGAGG